MHRGFCWLPRTTESMMEGILMLIGFAIIGYIVLKFYQPPPQR